MKDLYGGAVARKAGDIDLPVRPYSGRTEGLNKRQCIAGRI
jgi:hypothetical protein